MRNITCVSRLRRLFARAFSNHNRPQRRLVVMLTNLVLFFRYVGVCRKCRERLREMIHSEVRDIQVSELGAETKITEQMERIMLVSM